MPAFAGMTPRITWAHQNAPFMEIHSIRRARGPELDSRFRGNDVEELSRASRLFTFVRPNRRAAPKTARRNHHCFSVMWV
jgi:hypothetical protein